MKNFKDSGIEWLGEIPEHWEIKPLKAVFNQRNEQNTNLKLHTILSLIKDIGVVPYEEKGNIGNKSKEDLQSYKIARINDLVLNKMNAVIGSLGVSAYNGLVSPIYLVFYINSPKYLMSYYSYLFQIKNVQKFLKIYAYGIMEIRESIDYLDFKKMSLPVPPPKEQEQIANFLDEKCEKIKNFIEKKEKLINLLKEQKQALINETIAKGLDKNVNFKDSGIKYLGEIPQHWKVKRLANFGAFLKGNGISRQDLAEDGESAILYGDIYTKYQIKTHFLHSKISKKTSLSATPIYNGDILFSGSGETKEDIGKSVVYLGDDNAFAGGDVIIFRQKENNALFLSYVLNTKYANFCKSIDSKGEIIVHIYASNLKDIKIPLPPLKEQEQIANFLDEKCEKIDLLIEKTEKQIKLIKEYKTTLINQAVCGRINL
ncbi:restriction endonuclease subunit S [Campylobacter lari]|nr:restriction endonuclease subunit S [Campylobacter lari]EAK9890326.1 restriction endonuclease subunit S [Campylobacter lari]EGK8025018.1 restriction endonuclease subunit S [Campylobacter lari]EGK8128858.1 restriction endonuclease subunit S [Campylobacter lari]